MLFNFDSPSFKGFEIQAGLPADYRGYLLSGSEGVTATSERGRILVQTLTDPAFEIRYAIQQVWKPFKLMAEQQAAHLVSFLSLKNNLRFQFKGLPALQLKQGEFSLLHTQGQAMTAQYDRAQEYHYLEVAWSKERVAQCLPLFSVLKPLFTKDGNPRSFFLSINNPNAAYPAFDLARDILQAPYQAELNRVYFEYKVMEYLLYLLDRAGQSPAPALQLTEDERKRLLEIGFTVSQQPGKKFPISGLALQAHMNEMKLKMGFKQMYGQGIFEYQLAARMKEAHRLLRDSDMSTKAIASMVGYQLTTSFITKFREFFGYPPSAVAKKR